MPLCMHNAKYDLIDIKRWKLKWRVIIYDNGNFFEPCPSKLTTKSLMQPLGLTSLWKSHQGLLWSQNTAVQHQSSCITNLGETNNWLLKTACSSCSYCADNNHWRWLLKKRSECDGGMYRCLSLLIPSATTLMCDEYSQSQQCVCVWCVCVWIPRSYNSEKKLCDVCGKLC